MKELAHRYLLKPFQMLAMEPILLLVTLYMGFIYGKSACRWSHVKHDS